MMSYTDHDAVEDKVPTNRNCNEIHDFFYVLLHVFQYESKEKKKRQKTNKQKP